jgi:protein-tyrosine phosphatase
MDIFPVTENLAVVTRPRGGDWLGDELARLRERGIDTLVSCLTPIEEAELALDDEADQAQSAGLTFVRMPIEDRGLPPMTLADQVAKAIAQRIRAGGHVAVHCRQGLGRAPLVVGTVLVRSGVAPEDAWKAIARGRGQPVPDTPAQREWLRLFADLYLFADL